MVLFKLRGDLSPVATVGIQAVGAAVGLLLWHLVATYGGINRSILPTPDSVLHAFGDLWRGRIATDLPLLGESRVPILLWHTWRSVMVNLLGYLEAVALCLPLGFVLGLFPLPQALSERPLAAMRGLPLPAAMGIFIALFGIGTAMKVHFLAVGIAVFLLPTVALRVRETAEVYDHTARTLGASTWQRIWAVFVPDSLARVFNDISVLVVLSWTYITITEVVNNAAGGLGALAEISRRQSHVDRVYAVLIVVMAIVWVQDWAFKVADRVLFPYKYA